ncbi:MAG: hypothetical protein C4521_01255 [Actinobacteria bacterium]|jgi:hypothetical protein|nr:MAG: hypothetical protein C4521_01255 [Actinomycetota bacterium]
MDPKQALETVVRPKLEDSFGKAVAMLIIMSATSAARVPITELNRQQYLALVRALAQDERVLKMWGSSGTAGQLAQWEREVD